MTDPSKILSDQEGPLFKLKESLLETLRQSGQGTIIVGSPGPGGADRVKLSPDEPFVRGEAYANYPDELAYIPEEKVDVGDKVKGLQKLKDIGDTGSTGSSNTLPDTERDLTGQSEDVSFEDESDVDGLDEFSGSEKGSHQEYDYPDEDEPESPVEEDVGVDELPKKNEVVDMYKKELKEVAQSLDIYDDITPSGENGHVTKKDIKGRVLDYIDENK